jgi:drug/metabolite transporter (DMT)-like permease
LIALTSRTAIDGSSSLEGNLLSVLAAVIWAVYVVLQARYVNNVEDTAVAALTLTGGAIPLLIFGFPSIVATKWSALPADVWMAILYGGVISLAIASVFWYRGVRILGATRTGIYLHLEPVFALVAAWIWMHEHPTPLQGVGAMTILAGVTLTHT